MIAALDNLFRTTVTPVDFQSAVDARLVAGMRVFLATVALVVIYIDPTEPARLVDLTYAALSAYLAYSTLLFAMNVTGYMVISARLHHWIDVLFYVGLIGLTEGTNSIFFQFFYFAILVAAFRYGFREGIAVTIVSCALYVSVGYIAAPMPPDFDLGRALIRPLALGALGYLISFWGGREIALRRRLEFIKQLADARNARLGADHFMAVSMRRLVSYFAADTCIILTRRAGMAGWILYREDAVDKPQASIPLNLSEELAAEFLLTPNDVAATFTMGHAPAAMVGAPSPGWDYHSGEARTIGPGALEKLANLFDCRHFVVSPFVQHGRMAGWVYLIASSVRLGRGDCEFLGQAATQIGGVFDNITLMEDLSRDAASAERSRISRDLHDTTVQPYLGLLFGLEALVRKLGPGSSLAAEASGLMDMARLTVEQLRGYVARLRNPGTTPTEDELAVALRMQVAHYHEYFGIAVRLDEASFTGLSHRLSAEIYQIVCELLSNIRRHTRATNAFVEMKRDGNSVTVVVGNDKAPEGVGTAPAFTPKTVSERAAALGGTVRVMLYHSGYTLVTVSIPQ